MLRKSFILPACNTSRSHRLRRTFHRTLCLEVGIRYSNGLKTEVDGVSQRFHQVSALGWSFPSSSPCFTFVCSCFLWKLMVHCSVVCYAFEEGFKSISQIFVGLSYCKQHRQFGSFELIIKNSPPVS